jgi:hypothetical protein
MAISPRQQAQKLVAEAFVLAGKQAGVDGVRAETVPILLGIFDTLDYVSTPLPTSGAAHVEVAATAIAASSPASSRPMQTLEDVLAPEKSLS